ncbi:hypothetical protein [Actinopolyspora mortivallis]|uniref:Uncharacterized protein n=1 Tax=Actinopolyspora mortivallis TaxID=33906 RepID=A0A2T0GU14_ACTMO|nr:hypothetical protein [Actinopolyspora mortivallis]PRW62592.1 hypothetical protein CEP50_14830 [Actinopolyspora mortivallis]
MGTERPTERFWHPARRADGARHLFAGAPPAEGWSPRETLCGRHLDPSPVSSVEWLLYPTCPECWELLLSENVPPSPAELPTEPPPVGD